MKHGTLLVLLAAAAIGLVAASGCAGRRPTLVESIADPAQEDTTSLGIGKRYLAEKQYSDAWHYLQKAVEEEPANWEAHLLLGRVHAELGGMDSAKDEFRLALDLVSTSVQENEIIRSMRFCRYKYGPEAFVHSCPDSSDTPTPSTDRFAFDTYPKVIKSATPTYPESARKGRVEGKVVVIMTISRFGSVTKVCIEESSAEVLNGAAIQAAYAFRFTPAKAKGVPTEATISVPFRFSLAN